MYSHSLYSVYRKKQLLEFKLKLRSKYVSSSTVIENKRHFLIVISVYLINLIKKMISIFNKKQNWQNLYIKLNDIPEHYFIVLKWTLKIGNTSL